MPTTAELAGPTLPGQRIGALDLWRGLAVLGILLVNIQFFAMPSAAFFDPTAWGELTGVNYAVWLLTHVLGEGKFVTLFSMLFGVGMLVMTDRRVAAGRPWVGLHYRRMAGLLCIGLVHAYLIWYGDILVSYALCGLVLIWLRKIPPWGMLGVAAVLLGINISAMLFSGLVLEFAPPDVLADVEAGFGSPALIQQELEAYRGGWIAQMDHRTPMALQLQTGDFALHLFWFVGGMIALGMALYRFGILSGAASTRAYLILLAIAVMVGLPLTVLAAAINYATEWHTPTLIAMMGVDTFADLLLALGYLSGLMILYRKGWLGPIATGLQAVGRMALSNYLLQSILCTTIFYGHGFGLFGEVSRVGQFGVVVAVWAVGIVFSLLWLRWFRFGPVEWLWRQISYGRSDEAVRLTA